MATAQVVSYIDVFVAFPEFISMTFKIPDGTVRTKIGVICRQARRKLKKANNKAMQQVVKTKQNRKQRDSHPVAGTRAANDN